MGGDSLMLSLVRMGFLGQLLVSQGLDQPFELDVRGAKGSSAGLVNGMYELTETETESNKCYEKGDVYLCQHDGGWWIQRFADIASRSCYYYSPSVTLPPSGTWHICQPGVEQHLWKTELGMRVVDFGTGGRARKRPRARPVDETIHVSGTPSTATSDGKLVNGDYVPTTMEKNGKPCFKKADNTDFWICMGPYGYWLIQPEQFLGAAKGYIISTKRYVAEVDESGPFQLFDGAAFVPSPSIEIVARSASKAKLSWTAAATALAALVVIVVALAFTLSGEARLRSYTYRYISCSMTIFCAMYLTEAIWTALLTQDSAFLPKTTPLIAAIVGFTLFSLAYGGLLVLAWKLQYSHPRLYGLKTLGAHVTAFIGIFAFTVIQQEAVKVFPPQLESSIVSVQEAEVFTAIGVLIFSWCILAAYREASVGFRVERLGSPPQLPWSKKLTKQVLLPPASRSCTATFFPESVPPRFDTTELLPNWVAMVGEAEEEVAQLILSFLINQTAIYLLTKEMPGLKGACNASNEMYWWGVGAVFALAAVGMLCMRHRAGEGSRTGRVLQLSLALAASWSMYRLANSYLQDMYPRNHPLSMMASECVIACVSMSLMYLFDKAASNTSLMPKKLGDGQDSIFSMKYTLALCFGNITGLAGERSTLFAVDTIIEGTPILSQAPRISEFLLTILISLGVARCWWTTVLPKAEMTEPAHGKLIQLEADLATHPASFL